MNTAKKAALVLIAAGVAAGASAGAASANNYRADGALAQGKAVGSPGFLSGNLIQLPVHIPANLCGNTVDAVGNLNPAFGNTCINT
jgi:hypothetical protein